MEGHHRIDSHIESGFRTISNIKNFMDFMERR